MIEVEKKFVLERDELERLIKDARFITQKEFTDVYYDDNNYSLTTKNMWLRSRAGKFEFKCPVLLENNFSQVDHYEEIEDDDLIKRKLSINSNDPLIYSLEMKGYKDFASITTIRKKYKKQNFTIDIDNTDFGYRVAEIELLVNNNNEIEYASKAIIDFADACGIKIGLVRGKLIEYIRQNRPDHFKALELALGIS